MKHRYRALAIAAATAAAATWFTVGAGGEPAAPSPPAATSAAEITDLLTKVDVVDSIPNVPGYERGCGMDKQTDSKQACVFGPAWNDPLDHTGCDVRNTLLHSALQDIEYRPGTRGCKVAAGRLNPDPYTGQTVDLAHVAIDHIVPLKVAWNAGAAHWDLQQRRIFANDPTELIAVSSTANSSKGDSTLSEWLPHTGTCPYVVRYLTVAAKYQLPITVKDRAAATSACRAN